MKKGTYEEMEKRQSTRLEKTLPVKFGLPDDSSRPGVFEALSRNIGEGGVFIQTDLAQDKMFSLDKEKILNLEIELLGQAQRIKPRGEIAWISKKSRTPEGKINGLGIKFIQITAEEKRAISIFISREMLAQADVVEKEIPVILREQKLSDRQRRNLEILDIIRKNRLVSRAEISKSTGINIVTVSNYIDTYLKRGLVFERGLDISTGGRRPELVEINPDYGYVLGVDLGLLNVKSALMQVVATDFTASIKAQAVERRENGNIEDCLDTLKDLIGDVLASKQIERKKVRGIGVAICGIMDKIGGSVRNPLTEATFANYVTIKKELKKEFGLPVFVENAASCALFAEKWSGISLKAEEADNIIYILSDSQCAIMLKGELYTGSSKNAGLLNFALAQNNLSNANFCWMNQSADCIFRGQRQDSEMAPGSKEEISACGARLGAKVAYLVNIFNPQAVIISRHFSQSGDIFLDAIRRTVGRWAFKESADIARIIPASLGDEAAALGAAALVIESVLTNI